MLAGLRPDEAKLQARAKAIDENQLTMRAYIDELVTDERFAHDVVPSLVFGTFVNVRNYYALPATFILQRDLAGTYFLREPCAAATAVQLKPWWDPTTTVAVCPDAYRPDKWTLAPSEHGYRTKLGISCDSQIGSPEAENSSLCGCGPNLMRCMASQEQYEEVAASLMRELRDTTAYVVDHDLTMASLFTSRETFRDRNAEIYYRRQQAGAMETKRFDKLLANIDTWPRAGQWAPRDEIVVGQHAGLLTAPQFLHSLPDRRQRQRAYYEVLWCTLRNPFGATTEKVLEINAAGNNFFAHDSWSKLAHTPLCTNCHARLDYGFQFFSGFVDSRASIHLMRAEHQGGKGPLYGRSIDDPRGTADLSPRSFAKLATEQPEFTTCMTDHFASYVLGDNATNDDKRAIGDAVRQTGTFRAAMTVALERYALRARDTAFTIPQPAPHAGSGMSPSLRSELDRWCVDCHDDTSENGDFTKFDLPRKTLVDMTDKVAYGTMPKEHDLEAHERQRIVTLLVDQLWPDPTQRAEATRYFVGRGRGLPSQQIDNVLFQIGQLAAPPAKLDWGMIERALWIDQNTVTPGVIGLTALEALRACRAKTDEPLEQCLTRATAPRTLSRWPVDP